MSSEHVALARRWFNEVWVQHRVETIDEMLPPDSVAHTDFGDVVGNEQFKSQVFAPMLAGFPDLQISVENIISEGDQVAIRWFARGTHQGSVLGIAPTGRTIGVRGITWVRFENNQMTEGWDCWNQFALTQQIQDSPVTIT